MKFAELKGFRRSINLLWKRGGRQQKAANTITQLLGRIGTMEDPLHGLRTTNNGETRISNCVKYDLNDFCRLVTVQANGYCIFLTCGDHEEVDRWLESHVGFVPVVGENGRVVATYCSSEEVAERRVSGAPGHYDGPLRERLPEDLFDSLLEGLTRKTARAIESIDASATEEDLWGVVASVEDPEQRVAIHDVLSLLRQDKVVDAVARIKLFEGEVSPLATTPLPDIIDSDVIRRIDPASPQFAEALSRFMKTARYREWMLFLHPDQQRIVDEDFDGPAKLVGVSGSGKTCVVVQRAIRLAAKYPGERILIVTLNRALAALIADLIVASASDDVRDRIDVKAFFSLCRDLLVEREPAGHKIYDEVTWKSNEHVDEVWQEFYRCETNNYDARVFHDVHDSLLSRGWDPNPYLRQEVDWVRSAFRPDERSTYLSIFRKGRAVPLLPSQRDRILRGTAAWEDKMKAIGLIDTLGIAQRTSDYLSSVRPMYRSILVDEVQDFGNVELAILRALVPPGDNDLFLCGDGAQTVSSKYQALPEAGIPILKARARHLTLNYRNSRDVLTAAYEVLFQNLTDEMVERDDLEILDPQYSATTGATPLLLHGEGLESEIRSALAACRAKVADDPEKKACIAICGFSLYELSRFGDAVGLPVLDGTKPLDHGNVFLSDLEQTKGFEFDIVCVVNASKSVIPDALAPDEERYRDLSRLYVAMTRAKTDLVVSWSGEMSPFLAPAKESFYEAPWAEYVVGDDMPVVEAPRRLESFRDGTQRKNWRAMTGEEFLHSKAAIGVSTELAAKLRHLVDGVGLRRGNEQLKWRNLEAALSAYEKVPTSVRQWGPEVGRQLQALGKTLGFDASATPALSTEAEPAGGQAVRSNAPTRHVPTADDEPTQSTPPDHAKFLQVRFQPRCNRGSFSVDQWKQLQRFGHLYEALCSGAIKPLTEEQTSFVRFFRGEERRKPRTRHEVIWAAYRDQLQAKRHGKPRRRVTPRIMVTDESQKNAERSSNPMFSSQY